VITGNDGTVARTADYWIQGDKLFLGDSAHSLDVYGIKTVTGENLPQDTLEKKDELVQETRKDMDDLLNREQEIMNAQSSVITRITEPASGTVFDSKSRKSFLAEVEGNKGKLDALTGAWRRLRLPEFSLLRMRDVKMLQLMSLKTSMEQTVKFVKTGDPTYRESARVQMGMARSFDESFKTYLSGN